MTRISDDDDDFDSFEIDQADLDRIEALEANQHQLKETGGKSGGPTQHINLSNNIINVDVDDHDEDDFLIDESGDWNDSNFLNQLMEVEKQHVTKHIPTKTTPARHHYQQRQEAIAGPSSHRRAAIPSSSSSGNGRVANKNGSSGISRQRTLFGELAPVQSSQGMLLVATKAHTAKATSSQAPQASVTNSTNRQSFVQGKGKRKEWDAQQPLTVKRSKSSSYYNDDEGDLDDLQACWDLTNDAESDFIKAPLPLPPDAIRKMKIPIDREEAQKWIYPTNKEMRDYQYNIVQRALFNNVLVALPTGLGKTFIAAVVILNYYRWFPTVIFVAPTRPLVAQQQQACHGICGLPWDCAVEMTGSTKANLRGDEWTTKRIFYMTPQTFENDLFSSAVNAEDVVCVVVDEAHRATGNYAYGKVIKWITARNPFFRVLALTATPGNHPEKIQEVIDNLHINLIEIRTEEAVDIRKYVHTKSEDAVVVPIGGVVAELRDMFGKLMKPSLEILNNNGLVHFKDPCSLPSFAVTSIYNDKSKGRIIRERKLFNHVADLNKMARAMEYLVKYSVHMFHNSLIEMQSGISDNGKKAASVRQKNKFSNNTVISELEAKIQKAQDKNGKVKHPKMEYLQNVVTAHFIGEEEQGRREDTRIMVFCQFRACVNEIVNILNEQMGVRASYFVGQTKDSEGNAGMSQKDQEKCIQDFKLGKFNVLVATSIGEEGLDIGEVDLIVCYEAVKNSVRMLQRVGRTGRKRNGRIVVLMSEGSEEKNWQKSKDNHKTIQNELMNGSHLELFDDVERLVPEDITSVAVLKEVEQPPFEPSMIKGPTRQKKVPKPKRNSDPYRNVPSEGFKGFVKVSDMKRKKGRRSNREGDSSASDGSPPPLLARSSSSGVEEEEQAVGAPAPRILCLSDDSDDEQLERGIIIAPKKRQVSNHIHENKAQEVVQSTPANQITRKATGRLGAGRAARATSSSHSSESRASASSRVAVPPPMSSSPLEAGRLMDSPLQSKRVNVQSNLILSKVEESGGQMTGEADCTFSSPLKPPRRTGLHPLVAKLAAELDDESDNDESDESDIVVQQAQTVVINSSPLESPMVTKRSTTTRRKAPRLLSSSPVASMGPPALPVSVQKKTTKVKQTRVANPVNKSRKQKKIIGASPTSRRLFQYEADRSTDEEIHGEKDENDEGDDNSEDSSDREHVGDFAPTQAPKGYRQDAVYLQSLLTQGAVATPFRRPARGAQSGFQMGVNSEQVRQYVQDTPKRGSQLDSGDDDHYEKDSFICSDDEEIIYDSQDTSSQL